MEVRRVLNELEQANKVVGIKQLRKALGKDRVLAVFLADNADPALTEPLETICRAKQIPVTHVATMKELGRACGIAVGAAAAGLLQPQSPHHFGVEE